MRLFGDPDATVVIRPARWGRRAVAITVIAFFALLLVAVSVWHLAVPSRGLVRADAAEILAARPDGVLLYRFAPAPGIIVAVFPSLHAQAMALDRAAVFVEAAGVSRDHVPDDAALARIISDSHQSFDGFYYGHDYRAADLHRMWAMEDAQGLVETPEEMALRRALQVAEGEPGGFGAVISLPQPGGGLQDQAGRAAILRHELSHGLYFTDPAYARAVEAFWRSGLTAAQRAGFRRFLAGSFYDSANEDLMQNEMQAYLVNTPDTRFFAPREAGLTEQEAVALRAAFVASAPKNWLTAGRSE
jgi:hypothetical protein